MDSLDSIVVLAALAAFVFLVAMLARKTRGLEGKTASKKRSDDSHGIWWVPHGGGSYSSYDPGGCDSSGNVGGDGGGGDGGCG